MKVKPPEYQEPTKRKDFTPKQREAALAKTDGMCSVENCPNKAEEIDHIHAYTFGGEHEIDNWMPLCKLHHLMKTRQDQRANAKAKRLRRQAEEGRSRPRRGKKLESRSQWPKRKFPKRSSGS